MNKFDINRQLAEKIMGWKIYDAIPSEYEIPFCIQQGLNISVTYSEKPFNWIIWNPKDNIAQAMQCEQVYLENKVDNGRYEKYVNSLAEIILGMQLGENTNLIYFNTHADFIKLICANATMRCVSLLNVYIAYETGPVDSVKQENVKEEDVIASLRQQLSDLHQEVEFHIKSCKELNEMKRKLELQNEAIGKELHRLKIETRRI